MPYFGVLARRFAPWMLIILLSLGTQPPAKAQASSASVTVTIADPSGALVPKADVALRNVDTNQEQSSPSNKAGGASFPFLKPGLYSLVVSKPGFSDVTVNNVRLNVGDQRQFTLVLKVGSAEQSVTVDGSGLNINTTDASVSTVVDRKFVESMPLNGRSFESLILLAPGVVTNNPQTSVNQGATGEFSINGQRTDANYYTIDGVSANNGAFAGNSGSQASSSGGLATEHQRLPS
jgi:hypothetical protein